MTQNETPVRNCSPAAWRALNDSKALFVLYETMPSGWRYVGCDDETATDCGVGRALSGHQVTEACKDHVLHGVSEAALAGLARFANTGEFERWLNGLAVAR